MRGGVNTALIRDAIRICLDSLLVVVNIFVIHRNDIAQFICTNAYSGARALKDAGNRDRFSCPQVLASVLVLNVTVACLKRMVATKIILSSR